MPFFKIWIVIGLVIIGTYAFFVGISEIIISILQQVSKVYYHPRYFFVVVGMRVRLKMNAVSLATITLLCTFLIVTLTMTLTTYRDMNHTITKLITNDYDLSFSDNSKSQIERQQTIENIKRDIQGSVNAKDFKVYETTLFRASLEKNRAYYKLKQASDDIPIDFIGNEGAIFSRQSVMITAFTAQDYNRYHQNKLHLDNQSIGMITNVPIFKKQSKVGLNNEVFKVKQLDAHALNLMMIQDSMVLIVKDNNQLQKVKGFYAHEQKDSTISINFNVFGKTKLTTSQIQKLSKKYDASINSKSEMLMVWDRLTGGLIFVGGVVSIVLVIGIFLMMYYKQVSEAYANQHNYDIMKKLGLDNGRIAKITRNQMTFLFAIPITVALIHTLISSNIVYTLLNMIGINNHHIFLTSYVLAVIIISFLYMAMYKITSYIYAKVIHQQRN